MEIVGVPESLVQDKSPKRAPEKKKEVVASVVQPKPKKEEVKVAAKP